MSNLRRPPTPSPLSERHIKIYALIEAHPGITQAEIRRRLSLPPGQLGGLITTLIGRDLIHLTQVKSQQPDGGGYENSYYLGPYEASQ